MKYSKDGLVSFDPERHIYMKGDKRLQNITGYIKQFKNPFDSGRISKAYALKHGLKQEDVLKEWKDKADKSVKQGTEIHSIFENYTLSNQIIDVPGNPKAKVARQFINDYFKTGRLTPVETEMIVYDELYASQIDSIVKDERDNHFILDYKTNKEIKQSSFAGAMMLPPFDYLQDCDYSHYSIQTSFYKKLCKEYEIKGCYIIHIDTNSYKFIKPLKISL